MNNYEWEKVTDHIYLIKAIYGTHMNVMQLVVGAEKAALIDSGMGATGNLRALVGEITHLPTICLITHMHPDHAGAAMLFDERYLNPKDEIHCWWALTKEKRSLDLEDAFTVDEELRRRAELEMVDNSDFTYLPMYPGDVFELGGITLEVLRAQGHTEGSVVLYCKEENALFAGDAIAPKTILVGEHKSEYTPLTEIRAQLASIAKKTDQDTKLFCGHSPKMLSVELLDDILTALDNVLDGHPSKELPELRWRYEENGSINYKEEVGSATVIYNGASLSSGQS